MNLIDVEIQTERLSLKAMDKSYISHIFNDFTKDITTYMYPQPSGNIKDSEQFVMSSIEGLQSGTNLQLVIIDKSSQEFLGCCGLHQLNNNEPELGIWLKKSAHGHSYGLEAIKGIIDWTRTNMNYDHLKYPVDRQNLPSKRIPEYFKGKVVKEYILKNMEGKELDIVEYQISLNEF